MKESLRLVDKKELIIWYKKIADAGFFELETFDNNFEPNVQIPLKKSFRTQDILKSLRHNESDFWQAANDFYHDWPGWGLPKYQKKPYLRRVWELFSQSNYSIAEISKVVSYEGVINGTGHKLSYKTAFSHIDFLKKQMLEWLRVKQYYKDIGVKYDAARESFNLR